MTEWTHEHADLVQETAGYLRTRGGRMTFQRRVILEAFATASEHPTAGEIFQIARRKDASLNLSTVYRTMRWLEQAGLVQARLLDADSRSERFDSARPAAHHHFLCNRCGRIIEFDESELGPALREIERRHGLRAEHSALVVYGLCDRCLPAGKKGPATS